MLFQPSLMLIGKSIHKRLTHFFHTIEMNVLVKLHLLVENAISKITNTNSIIIYNQHLN